MTGGPHAERRPRIAVLHHLHPDHRAGDVCTATGDMVALHATDPASVFLGLLARTGAVPIGTIESALYEDRSIQRIMAMRRTLFVVRSDGAVVPFAACTLRVAARERARLLKQLATGSDIVEPERWLAHTMSLTTSALADLVEATAQQLSTAVPELQTRWDPAPGTKWGGDTPLASRVLSQLSMEGVIERGRPTGAGFLSTRYRWRLVPEPLTAKAIEMGEDEGRWRLVAHWLERFGPGTEADLVWWTGLTKTQIRRARSELDLETVDLDGAVGFSLAGQTEVDDPGPWVSLLPGLDPTVMGWRDRDWYLEPSMVPELFDRAGNAGPTVWCDGRVVGGWAQRRDGEIVVELLDDISDDHRDLLEIERVRLLDFLDGVTVTPRFRTPLERRLVD